MITHSRWVPSPCFRPSGPVLVFSATATSGLRTRAISAASSSAVSSAIGGGAALPDGLGLAVFVEHQEALVC